MKTALIVLLILVIVLILTFFQSSHYLKKKLLLLEEDLEKLPATTESFHIIAEIGHIINLPSYSDPEWKRKARILIRKTYDFIRKNVPCYGESREILTLEQREYSTKCEKCNGKYHCVFHKEWRANRFRLAFF